MRLWFQKQPNDTDRLRVWQILNAKLRVTISITGSMTIGSLLMAYRACVRVMAKRHLSRRSQKSYVNWNDFNRFTEAHALANPGRLTDLIALGRQRMGGRDK